LQTLSGSRRLRYRSEFVLDEKIEIRKGCILQRTG
jgi:hypothetical protein